MANAMAAVEFARVDASLATFSLVHNFLALITIGLLGSEEQKQAHLPAMAKYEQVGGVGGVAVAGWLDGRGLPWPGVVGRFCERGFASPVKCQLVSQLACVNVYETDSALHTTTTTPTRRSTLPNTHTHLQPEHTPKQQVGCWALTEPSNGSDASGLTCSATKVPGGWQLDGQKRWIGNGTWADVVVVWARNSESGEVRSRPGWCCLRLVVGAWWLR